MVCVVKKKPTRLTLNVKGDGCSIHDSLQIESSDGAVVALAPGGALNAVDFGQVIVNERAVRAVVMVNSGETGAWHMHARVCVCVCMHACACVCACMYVSICVGRPR